MTDKVRTWEAGQEGLPSWCGLAGQVRSAPCQASLPPTAAQAGLTGCFVTPWERALKQEPGLSKVAQHLAPGKGLVPYTGDKNNTCSTQQGRFTFKHSQEWGLPSLQVWGAGGSSG